MRFLRPNGDLYLEQTGKPGPPLLPEDPDSARKDGAARKKKVMVVDDEPLIADTLVEILLAEGFEAVAVSNSAAGVKWAKMMRPDFIISDVIMPGMNGIEMAKAIRNFLPQCKIVLFSGQAATRHLLQAEREEGHDFQMLPKPIRPNVLLALLESLDSEQKQ